MIRALKSLKTNMGVFLQFEIPFRILLIFLFLEGFGRIVDILLHFQGYSYVTQGNYRSFLRHPSAIAGLILIFLLLLLLIAFEFCGLLLLFDAGSRKIRLSLAELLRLAGKQTFLFIRTYPVRWILFLLICLPNLYLHFLLWEVERARMIDIVAADLAEAIGIPLFVILLLGYFLLSALFSMTLPFRIFGRKFPFSFRPKAFLSRRKKRFFTVLQILFLQIRVLLATGLVYMLLVVFSVWMIRLFRPVYRYVSDALFYGSLLRLFLGLLIGFFGTVTITGYLYSFFRHWSDSCIDWSSVRPSPRPKLVLIVVFLCTGVILVSEYSTFIPDASSSQDFLEITAHRGGAKFTPENTLAAIQYSIDTRADYAEIDVQETSDGEIVLLHDSWLGRTTGVRKYIWNTTFDELQSMDAGSYFSASFRGEKIPSLREVIQTCRGHLRLNIELKSNGHNKDIVKKVVTILQEENFLSNCIITSMDYALLKETKELCPEVVTGYTLSMVYGNVKDMEAADIYSVKYTFINSRLTEQVHSLGKQICAWTANNRPSIRKAIDAGADNVITDDPELVRKELMREYDIIPGFLSLVRYMIQ